MRGTADERGVSIMVEYILLTGILGVFIIVFGLYLHDALTQIQVARVIENQFADVASQISAFYTDYILLRPSSGYIKTKISILPEVGERHYVVNFSEVDDRIFVVVKSVDGRFEAQSGLGLDKFVLPNGERMEIKVSGEVLSIEAGEERPEISYERVEPCPFDVKPRIDFEPSSVPKGDYTTLKVYFENQITEPVSWNVTLWNGSVLQGSGASARMLIKVDDTTGCNKIGSYDYECLAEIFAWINESEYFDDGVPRCNGSSTESLFVSEQPTTSNPYITYDKWVEPKIVAPGDIFEVHLKLEGRGFVNQAINLSVVHMIDVSGSMRREAIYKEFEQTIVPNVVERVVNTTDYSPNPGTLEIYAYTTDTLSDWYYDLSCNDLEEVLSCNDLEEVQCSSCNPPPWNGKGMDSSFVKLYVNDAEVGAAYSSGGKIGKQYSISNAMGSYDIKVVARAPDQINLTIIVKFNGSVVLNETIPYSNYQELTFELPNVVDFEYLEVSNLQGSIPYWYVYRSWSWWWGWRYYCTYYDNHNDNRVLLNAWVVEPSGDKYFVYDIYSNYDRYNSKYSYENNNPQHGTYRIVVVPTTKEPATFKATVYLKRIDAAKLAAIQFNSMLGEKDFVGLAKFSTDAERIAVNSSPLKYMTTDKDEVNDVIRSLEPSGATDHADALYAGINIFPIWNEAGNNCTDCINNTRPLMILLTDGETTICDEVNYFGCNLCSGTCDGSHWCQSGADQARCVADYIKNNIQINGFAVSICAIGFGTDIGSNGQELLREIVSLRPDNNEPCYFFATTSEELLEAYRTIFNIFQIAAKNISINETLNVTFGGPFEFVSAVAKSNRDNRIDLDVERLHDRTVVRVNVTSIQKDETIEIIVKLRVKEEAEEGVYEINIEGSDVSYIDFTPLNYRGEETTACPAGSYLVGDKCRMNIVSDKDRVVVTSGSGGEITLE